MKRNGFRSWQCPTKLRKAPSLRQLSCSNPLPTTNSLSNLSVEAFLSLHFPLSFSSSASISPSFRSFPHPHIHLLKCRDDPTQIKGKMPLVRVQVKNEFGLGKPDLYMESNNEDPKAVLDGVAVAGLVGILRQLGDLAEYVSLAFLLYLLPWRLSIRSLVILMSPTL